MPKQTPSDVDSKIRYGPFKRNWRSTILMMTLVPIAIALSSFFSGGTQALHCDREANRCVLESRHVFIATGSETFSVDAVRGVSRHFNRVENDIELDVTGHRGLIIHRGSEETYEEMHSFFFDMPRRAELHISMWPGVFQLLFLAFFTGMGISLLFALLRRPGSIVLVLERETLLVKEHWAGIALRSRRLSVNKIKKISVGHFDAKDGVGLSGKAARVWLVTEEGIERPLTKTGLAGTDVHDRMAAELGTALGLKS